MIVLNKVRKDIKNLRKGECGWAVPWALYTCQDQLYLNGDYSVNKACGGTAQLFVMRTELGITAINHSAVMADKTPVPTLRNYWGPPVQVDFLYVVAGEETYLYEERARR